MNAPYGSKIDKNIDKILKKLPKNASNELKTFVEQFYQQIPLAALELVNPDKAAAYADEMLDFLKTHKYGKSHIRILTDQTKKDGNGAEHLIVQILNDDKPFLVDSLTNRISQLGFNIHSILHPIFRIRRDDKGVLKEFVDVDAPKGQRESFIHFELSALPKDMTKKDVQRALEETLTYVNLAIDDWKDMLGKTLEAREGLAHAKHYNQDTIKETEEFLDWLMHRNFVFLGFVEIDFKGTSKNIEPVINKKTALGISKIDDIPDEISIAPTMVDMRKASRYSKVHRHALMDVVTVKRFDEKGNTIGEYRFYGLLTSTAYYQSASTIPLVGRKIERLLKRAGFPSYSHNAKTLMAILQFIPRDELFQISEEDLFELSMGVLALETRPGVKLFARTDIPRRYISALVYVPRELFSTSVRLQVTNTLQKYFAATLENFIASIGESSLARLHLVFRTSKDTPEKLPIKDIEQEIATAIMLWPDKLKAELKSRFDVHHAAHLFNRYAHAFDAAYTSRYPIVSTVYDIEKMQASLEHKDLELELYQERDEPKDTLHLKIYNIEEDIALSDILPKLEHMGLRVVDEQPYVVRPTDSPCLRMRDIRMTLKMKEDVNLAQVKPNVEELLRKVWHDDVEDDTFNALVFTSSLNVRQIEVIRALYQYMRQIRFPYGKQSVGKALKDNPMLTSLLVQLFETRFDPDEDDRDNKMAMLCSKIEQGLVHVESLQEDKVISTMQQIIMAMLRTNYYIRGSEGHGQALSFKIDSTQVPNIPLPKPFAEIFVYSARVEGIHLRGGKVARGGLRWSDRHGDYRTEVLGLMKAQMVKNAVIVPVGSKGGFVVKQVSPNKRDAYREEGIECYKEYLRGLLDVTDNVINHKVVTPKDVVRHDGDDPYLVVAADKGTATFSDTANSISQDYGFWLDDAFASGGSAGYDHKEMGITARGAWVSVERHFHEMGHDMEKDPFTVIGIGDMSGDVFGNGMLLSENIELVAAFNHLHIFFDPTPDTKKSFKERKRLFEMPRSSWADYDKKLISKGGGVFERSAKKIKLTAQMKKILDTELDSCSPDELIKLILQAPVDLLWNGGIGTYVKAARETHDDVGDRTNNAVRINGNELRAKVVGEGGNLGFTQLGRIEYARNGGRINTDAIDNSGGVDCSDHEVNIKIGLQPAVKKKKLSIKERNHFLESMTDEVAGLVLKDNQLQTQAISIEQHFATQRLPVHAQLIRILEKKGLLDRAIEFLPDESTLTDLRERRMGLTRPEISVLLAYSKLALFADVLESSMPDESYFSVDLKRYFPEKMQEKFAKEIEQHSLKREIIATVATNSMVNRAGLAFYFDILEDTKLPARDIVAAYSLARDIMRMRDVWAHLEKLQKVIPPDLCAELYDEISKLLKYLTFWLLRHRALPLDISKIIDEFCKPAQDAMEQLESMLTEAQLEPIKRQATHLAAKQIPKDVAKHLAILPLFKSALDICSVAKQNKKPIKDVGALYFAFAEKLEFMRIMDRAKTIPTQNRWDRLALQSVIHEFHDELARIIGLIFANHKGKVEAFEEQGGGAVQRFMQVVSDMLMRDSLSTPMLMVALGQLKQIGN